MRRLPLILAITCAGLVACGDETSSSATAGTGTVMPTSSTLPAAFQPGTPAGITASAPKQVAPGEVFVAPVSKTASAPGIDPMDAATLPPMPPSAPASARQSKR